MTPSATFTLTATEADLAILTDMQRAGGHPSLESIAAHALLLYARHLAIGDIPMTFLAADREAPGARRRARTASAVPPPSD